ncbi:hypothetical protein HBI24_036160 [Parastagonospora nodorum]|nr:hypothetical protein HBI10_043000 [Parastagonospora nodorum]KAH4030916.1 hypothetical protein HBI13_026450 [Parastagonospora nodorum]KAH4056343.1 hypothetical protein HBH49_052260 [Parastagonospora nodorum]KAH4094028.1 hypothetical protein HBH48_067630 [Parastagonospora nodorum]KAH4168444.1 hypothetical protein HBH43_123940 [Parastagonospora nodorum]
MARNWKKVAKPKLIPNTLHFERMVRVFDAMETPHLTRATRTKRKLLDEVSFFLTLPQELRDMVYHELWKARPQICLQITQKGRLQAIKLQYGTTSPNLPLKRGLDQFFHMATWTVNDKFGLSGFSVEAKNRNSLAGPLATRNLTIVNMDISNYFYESFHGLGKQHTTLIYPKHYPNHQGLTSSPMPHLKSLQLHIDCSDIAGFTKRNTLDLSCIDATTMNLERLRITSPLTKYPRRSPELRHFYEVVRPIVDKEVLRLGHALLGADHHLEIEENLPAILLSAENEASWVCTSSEFFITWTFVREEEEEEEAEEEDEEEA